MSSSTTEIIKLALLQEDGPIAFQHNPMEFILKKYVTLQQILMELMTPSYREYVDAVFVIAPKPTTFKIVLHNSQYFYLTYLGIAYEASVSGMKYHLTNIGEKQRAMLAISRLLRAGNPNLSQGPDGAEDGGGFEDGGVSGGGGGGFSSGGGENTGMEGDWAEKTGFSGDSGGQDQESTDDLENLEESKAIIKEVLSSASKKKATEKAIDSIIKSPEGSKYEFKKLSDWRRLGNMSKISHVDFMDLLKKVFSPSKIDVHSPKAGPNYSSKYNMYAFDTENGPVEIILAGGANLGEKYEKNIVEKMKSFAGKALKDIEDPAVKKIFATTKVDPKKLKPQDIEFSGTTDTKRQLSSKGPTDVGEKIADVRIVPKNINISLKNKDGNVLYNGGIVPFIREVGGKVVYDKAKKDVNPIVNNLIDSIGLNPQKMVAGLNDYINSSLEEDNSDSGFMQISSFDKKSLKNILASAYGYGYYYVRQVKKDDVEIKPILDKKAAIDLVGDIKSVHVKYPSPTTKSTTVKIQTKTPYGDNQYQIEFRNTSGKVIPISYKISSKK